ncbi:TPM domain-containing protein [Clostridium sp. SM-530-WT-3G]|nr:TPM domain-containing protein [Clostridium sp. SM-530-WT-3G]
MSIIMTLALLVCILPVPSYADNKNVNNIPDKRLFDRIVDNADILTDSEEKSLLSKADEISERQKCDIAIVTVNSIEGKTPTEYTDDFFDYNGYGIGQNKDGILFLIAMNEHEWAISTHGYGITAFTDAGQKYMMKDVITNLSSGKYEEAFSVFLDYCDDYLTQAYTGTPYDSGNLPKEPVSSIWILGSLCIGAVIAFIILSTWKKQLKTVEMQNCADNYIVPNSFELSYENDVFLYDTIIKVEKPKDNDSGSSTHTSSSGEEHGGSSGSF